MNEIGYDENNCFEKEWLTFDWDYKFLGICTPAQFVKQLQNISV